MVECRTCGVQAPEGAEGWAERLCPPCRAERNARARANAAEIAQGLARELSRGWRGGATFVSIWRLPHRQLVSTWALGAAEALSLDDREQLWRETGDGYFLMSAEREGVPAEYRAITVEDGIAREAEPIDEAEIGALVALALALEQPAARPAELVIAVDPEVRVHLRDVAAAPRLLS